MAKNTHYEITLIVDGNIPDNEHVEIIKKVKDLLLENKANIISEINFGRKKLSYPINKSQKGNYFSFEFNLDGDLLKAMGNKLKLEKEILRFLIIKKPANAINRPFEEKEEAKKKVEQPKKAKEEKIEKKKEEPKEEIIPEIKPEKEEKIEEKKEAHKDEQKSVDKDELDEKLDEILNKDSF